MLRENSSWEPGAKVSSTKGQDIPVIRKHIWRDKREQGTIGDPQSPELQEVF
jgi:hypothetical protein